jgi:phospholipid/cholesterol/gamma-HCH transport system substrate-binding protein
MRQDTVAGIRMTSMLGGQYLGLTFGTPGVPELPAGSTVRSSESTGVDALLENIGSLTKDAKEMILSLNRNQNEVMTRITAMLDENRLAVRDSLHGLASITTTLDRGGGSLAMLLNDKTLYKNAAAMTGSLREVSARLERGEGTLGKLLTEDEMYTNANSTLKSFNQVAQRINRGEGTAGKLLTDTALYDELRETISNMKDITRKINEGQGTIGKLVNDDKLYLDATATLKKAEKAMEGLQDTGPISVIGSVIGTLF